MDEPPSDKMSSKCDDDGPGSTPENSQVNERTLHRYLNISKPAAVNSGTFPG
ncbi:Hypothetical predicted protein [Xyrichtys novacula]|uniref:Uncharacterized protein n=1 Tax=Xyrichtys novacula TaxID=13765 RepID=A0AAV1FLD2_XYRNO|nr:Hypothetical predicted protein [Xyrichtys novacula]